MRILGFREVDFGRRHMTEKYNLTFIPTIQGAADSKYSNSNFTHRFFKASNQFSRFLFLIENFSGEEISKISNTHILRQQAAVKAIQFIETLENKVKIQGRRLMVMK